jgi:hypothetical protein
MGGRLDDGVVAARAARWVASGRDYRRRGCTSYTNRVYLGSRGLRFCTLESRCYMGEKVRAHRVWSGGCVAIGWRIAMSSTPCVTGDAVNIEEHEGRSLGTVPFALRQVSR